MKIEKTWTEKHVNDTVTFRKKRVGNLLKEGHPWDFNLKADIFFS